MRVRRSEPDRHEACTPFVVDLATPPATLDTSRGATAHVTVCYRGHPLGTLMLETPLDTFPVDVLIRRARQQFEYRIVDIAIQDAVPAPSAPDCSATVVVCTRDRYDALARCLDSISRLAVPGGFSVLVVDNGAGDDATRELVTGHGYRWVHEPVKGLDRARNRALLETDTDVILFTDDDVEVDTHWAAHLISCFRDPMVAAAGGLVLPAVLDTPAQRAIERHAGFSRGVNRRIIDGSRDAPTLAGGLGAGASMAFRRAVLVSLGGFPEELDGGMATRSGGDTFGFYRILRAGYRGVYEPRALAVHWHRDGPGEPGATLEGYSTGTYAYLGHALLREGDAAALMAMLRWTHTWIGKRTVAAMLRRPSAPPLESCLAEIRGALAAPRALRIASREVTQRGALLPRSPDATTDHEPMSAADRHDPRSATEAPVAISVVIPTRGRRDSITRLVGALDRQRTRCTEIIVVVDGDIDHTEQALLALATTTRLVVLVHPVNRGAAAARNTGAAAATGEVLLFLDDDVVPMADDLFARHWGLHERHDEDVAAVGECRPTVGDTSALSHMVRNWWSDHTGRIATVPELGMFDLVTGNMSIRRSRFAELGGFEDLARREDWEFGHRLVEAGVPIIAAVSAEVAHAVDSNLRDSLADRHHDAAGDLEIARRHPEIAHILPVYEWFGFSTFRTAMISSFFETDRGRRPLQLGATRGLALLDRLGSRRQFTRWYGRAAFLEYWRGVAEHAGTEEEFLSIVIDGPAMVQDRPIALFEWTETANREPSPAAQEVEVRARDHHIARVPRKWGGFPWDRTEFAEQVRWRLHDDLARVVLEGERP